jgi:hypothetical protein
VTDVAALAWSARAAAIVASGERWRLGVFCRWCSLVWSKNSFQLAVLFVEVPDDRRACLITAW